MLHLYMYLAAGVLLALAWVIKTVLENRIPSLPFPVVGKAGDKDFSQAVIEGYKKVRRHIQQFPVTGRETLDGERLTSDSTPMNHSSSPPTRRRSFCP
jgi:hypothetical protein